MLLADVGVDRGRRGEGARSSTARPARIAGALLLLLVPLYALLAAVPASAGLAECAGAQNGDPCTLDCYDTSECLDQTCVGVTPSAENTACGDPNGDSCDADDSCDGAGTCVDRVASDTEVCRAGSGDLCDPDEFCDGVSPVCPDDVVLPADTVCRQGTGDLCDPDEVCSGEPGEGCPINLVAAAGTICNEGSGDLCDPDEVCSGDGGAPCPEDRFGSDTTVCNPTRGDEICDPAELCPGVPDAACPGDLVANAGTACGVSADTLCTEPDTCDGSGTCETHDQVCGLVTRGTCPVDDSPQQGTCIDAQGFSTGEACDLAAPDCSSGSCVDSKQFLLAFEQDSGGLPNTYLLKDDGVLYTYNAFYEGPFPGTLTLTIPFPFVTTGLAPIYISDGAGVRNVSGCLPSNPFIAMSEQKIALGDFLGQNINAGLTCDLVCDPNGAQSATGLCAGGSENGHACAIGDAGDACVTGGGACVQHGSCSFDVDVQDPGSGIAHVQVFLEYGLFGDDIDANPCDDDLFDRYAPDAVANDFSGRDAFAKVGASIGGLAIPNLYEHVFSHTHGNGNGNDGNLGDVLENRNEFSLELTEKTVISYAVEAGEPNSLVYNGVTARPADAVNLELALLAFAALPDAPVRDLDAVSLLPDGDLLFSTAHDVPEGFGGLPAFRDGDVIAWDGNTATLHFSEDAFTDDENVDAFEVLPNGDYLISTEDSASIGGFDMEDGDIVSFDPSQDLAMLYLGLSESALFTGNPQSDPDIDALTVHTNGLVVLSLREDGDGRLGNNFEYQASDRPSTDLFIYDPASGETSLLVDGENLFDDPDGNGPQTGTRNIDAAPEPGMLLQLLAGLATLTALRHSRLRQPRG